MTLSQSSFRDPILRRCAAGFFGVALLTCVLVFFKQDLEWVRVFVRAAKAMRDGADVYVAVPDYRYPPVMAFVLIPLSDAPDSVDRLVWCVANLVAVVVLIRSAWRLCAPGRSCRRGGGARALGFRRRDRLLCAVSA